MAIENTEKFPQIVRSQFFQLGTEIDVQIVVQDNAKKDEALKNIEDIKQLYVDFSSIFSRFDDESELSKLNSKLNDFNPASRYMCDIIAKSLELNKFTDGFYDPRILEVLENVGYAEDFKTGNRKLGFNVDKQEYFTNRDLSEDLKIKNDSVYFGVRMDFSGIAKGYITDQVAKFLQKKGYDNYLIDSGGDMFMQGVDEQGRQWTVGIDGISENKLVFAIDRMGIATSGIGRRRWEIEGRRIHHIINPKNPKEFSFDLKSVSVVSESTTTSDVLAKTIFLMGSTAGIAFAKKHDLASVILSYRGGAWISPAAKKYIHNDLVI